MSVTDVHKSYRAGLLSSARVRAVDGVSLELAPGETLGIVGESGSGKSTLARMLVGLERPDSGSVLFRGRPVAQGRGAAGRATRRSVQMVFQDPLTSLNPRMTVLDIIAEPLDVHGLASGRAARRARVEELLGLVGLAADMAQRFPHEFSGGQRQRIGIARALATEPDVLVCDEPVSALDMSVQAQVVNLFADLQRRLGVSLVFIAHDLAVVRHVSHRVAVMYLGRIAEVGPADRVYTEPAHPYTQALLAAAPVPEPAARDRERIELKGDPPSPLNPPSGCPFHTRCHLAQDVCTTTVPPLAGPKPDPAGPHRSACHFSFDRP
nr:oligopeptide/dipeptide ABC transporter ATP-binding protein [Allonocardiopsis opalescens]